MIAYIGCPAHLLHGLGDDVRVLHGREGYVELDHAGDAARPGARGVKHTIRTDDPVVGLYARYLLGAEGLLVGVDAGDWAVFEYLGKEGFVLVMCCGLVGKK